MPPAERHYQENCMMYVFFPAFRIHSYEYSPCIEQSLGLDYMRWGSERKSLRIGWMVKMSTSIDCCQLKEAFICYLFVYVGIHLHSFDELFMIFALYPTRYVSG